jgi:Flagellar biogenesis protein
MQTSPLLLAAVGAQTQSAIPSVPPASPAVQAAPSAATTIIPDISLAWGGYFQALAILCFALAALWLILWLTKRARHAGVAAPHTMRIESRLALGPKNWLYVVRCQDKRLILGVSEKNVSLISESKLTEEEMKPPAGKSLFPIKGLKGFLDDKLTGGRFTGGKRQLEDDFPLLQEPQGQNQSAFDAFLQDGKK